MIVKHALRSLRRTPAFTIAAILTLVLGIASAGSMFAVVHGVLLAPLPYGEPERLVSIGLQATAQQRMQQPPAAYFTYRQFAQQLAGIGFYRTGNANIGTEGVDEVPERVTATWLTASMVPLLRVQPLLGRSFTADEEQPGGPSAMMLSESEWRTRFAASERVIGKSMMVNSVPREIVGVMPARFAFPTADTRVWLSARLRNDAVVGEFAYSGVGRLKAGATAAQVQLELATLLPKMAESFPQLESGGATRTWLEESNVRPVVSPLRDAFTGDIAGTLWILTAAAGLVLLVAWANVTNLMLIRADARQTELAVRDTLGAGRLRIAAHFLGESLLLGAAAVVLALFVVYGAVHALVAFGPADIPRIAELGLSLATLGFVTLITALGVILCAVVPAVRFRRVNLASGLRDGARGETVGRARQRLRMGIASLQIAVALVVSVGSGLLLRTAYRLNDVHPGFDANDVTTLWTLLPFARYDDAAAVAFYSRLAEQVRALPAVTAAGLTMKVPLAPGWMLEQTFRVDGNARTLTLPVNVVDAGYFQAMNIPLYAGHHFPDAAVNSPGIEVRRGTDILINQQAAKTLFGDASGGTAIGKRLMLAPMGPTYTIIGITGDVRDRDLATIPSALVYRPQTVPVDAKVEPSARHMMALVVKSKGTSSALVPAIRRIVRDLDPTVPIFNVETMGDIVHASTARLSLTLTLITVAAAITLLLGAIGLYGVMAYMVALRTREFGVRVALGADPGRIARLVAMRGLALTASGIAAGFVLYAIASPFLQAFLFGVTVSDPLTLAGATLVLVTMASFATWLPAKRAARIDPAEALRAE